MTNHLTPTEVPCGHCDGTGAYTHSTGRREACVVCDGYGTLAARPPIDTIAAVLAEHEPYDWGPEGCRCKCGHLSNDNPRHQAEQVAQSLDLAVAASQRGPR